ncbi:hypothetical protein GQ55_3G186300 [Panicum hallii var. hallii]|uniref:Uncharacterized protein n=1 Tax=Panicum hallii var. hallii TaxID=1504633 RepID=A0A2T7EAY0_9POAL|nr:hypothetical protein GQ55_3G186300 [Panicum hallii var. hallii]PUZ64977.1 hypothetical protein GQ55_3G186300 [Panicum hallii var. hallii]PUZ64978.1 hypothetical protein GQ55_3G186300 [Panicum hallii var. hallii]
MARGIFSVASGNILSRAGIFCRERRIYRGCPSLLARLAPHGHNSSPLTSSLFSSPHRPRFVLVCVQLPLPSLLSCGHRLVEAVGRRRRVRRRGEQAIMKQPSTTARSPGNS